MSIDLTNESGQTVDERGLISLAGYCLERLRIHPQAELSIMVADVATMTSYHERFMGEPGPTDVLSFPMDELRPPRDDDEPVEGILGDIVICPEIIGEQAAERGRDVGGETEYLLVHGLLHLLGFDHATPEEKAEMFGLKDRLLADYRSSRAEA